MTNFKKLFTFIGVALLSASAFVCSCVSASTLTKRTDNVTLTTPKKLNVSRAVEPPIDTDYYYYAYSQTAIVEPYVYVWNPNYPVYILRHNHTEYEAVRELSVSQPGQSNYYTLIDSPDTTRAFTGLEFFKTTYSPYSRNMFRFLQVLTGYSNPYHLDINAYYLNTYQHAYENNTVILNRPASSFTMRQCIFSGLFTSGGMFFDGIYIQYMPLLDGYYYDNASNSIVHVDSTYNAVYGYWVEYHLQTPIGSRSAVIAYQRQLGDRTNSSGQIVGTYVTNHFEWVDSRLQSIDILLESNDLSLNGTAITVTRLSDLLLISPYINTNYNTGGALGGVFGLLGDAFGSFASIFAIAIAPGLTIGTLVLCPLVVLALVLIFKAVRG